MWQRCLSKQEFNNSVTLATSPFFIGLSPAIDGQAGNFFNLRYLAIGVPGGRELNLTSTSFLGLRLLCQYVAFATGVGIVTPAVYTAYQMLCKFTLRVISFISTGARRLALKSLCTHKKLISAIIIVLLFNDICTGTPAMNPNSLYFLPPRTPTSHSSGQPGGYNAHLKNGTLQSNLNIASSSST